jgi:hypothetical protein
MRKLVGIAIALSLLAGCTVKLSTNSPDLDEQISVKYSDNTGIRVAEAVSSSGERFSGTIIWVNDPDSSGTSGKYRGSLTGDKGRTLSVVLECSKVSTKCVGSARSDADETLNIF